MSLGRTWGSEQAEMPGLRRCEWLWVGPVRKQACGLEWVPPYDSVACWFPSPSGVPAQAVSFPQAGSDVSIPAGEAASTLVQRHVANAQTEQDLAAFLEAQPINSRKSPESHLTPKCSRPPWGASYFSLDVRPLVGVRAIITVHL